MIRAFVLLLLPLALLTGCTDKSDKTSPERQDPEMAGALREPVMIDPDLAGMNQRGAALTGGGVPAATIPLDEQGADVAAAAKAEAAALVSGALQSAPPSAGSGVAAHGETAALTARNVLGSGNACTAKMTYTAAWAARLPAPFPVYPRGHVQEAVGADGDHCHVRAINFRVAVTPGDVLDFYYTRASKAGFAATHRSDGGSQMLSGGKGSVVYAVLVRAGADGLTEVDLVTSGG